MFLSCLEITIFSNNCGCRKIDYEVDTYSQNVMPLPFFKLLSNNDRTLLGVIAICHYMMMKMA